MAGLRAACWGCAVVCTVQQRVVEADVVGAALDARSSEVDCARQTRVVHEGARVRARAAAPVSASTVAIFPRDSSWGARRIYYARFHDYASWAKIAGKAFVAGGGRVEGVEARHACAIGLRLSSETRGGEYSARENLLTTNTKVSRLAGNALVIYDNLRLGHLFHSRKRSVFGVRSKFLKSRHGDSRGVVDVGVCDFKLDIDTSTTSTQQAAHQGQETTHAKLCNADDAHSLRLDSRRMRDALFESLLQHRREIADSDVDHQRYFQNRRHSIFFTLEAWLAAIASKALPPLVVYLVQAWCADALADIVHASELVPRVCRTEGAGCAQVSGKLQVLPGGRRTGDARGHSGGESDAAAGAHSALYSCCGGSKGAGGASVAH